MSVMTQTYRPSMTVGQVYARPYGSATAPVPIGNVLELSLGHKEDVQRQDDMTRLGGGVHAEVRRVMIERFGAERYLLESDAGPVHRDDYGVLYRREIDDDEPIVMVRLLIARQSLMA